MSLFANLGQGDIWALSGISFASAINDILDKEDFTLEELLEEDELIQEVKSRNERLIDFLALESTIDQLIDFIISGPLETENDLRVYKYPYMSCEVICCEIPEILNNFVEQHDGKYLKKLFTVLSSNEKLDNYLSGYFEKILEMLFRRMTVPMMKFLNEAGTDLLVDFLKHMDNYSVMQIVQRLMLPHIPFNNQADREPMEEVQENSQCNWSYLNESCVLLLDKLFDESNPDVPLHISDLLITVLQLSPSQTLVIKRLCEPECIEKLLTYSVMDGADSSNVSQPISGLASMSLASISVLESLISRLFESSLPFEQSQNFDRETENEHFAFVKVCIDSICEQFVKFIPQMNTILRSYLSDSENPCEALCSQAKTLVPRLGHRGLQLVKLIESVVRLFTVEIDKAMCDSGLFRTCIDLMYHFKNNSLLHLSVQRLLITVIESDRSRSETQLYLFVNCNLMHAVMKTVSCFNKAGQPKVPEEEEGEEGEEEDHQYYATKHTSIMGNAILLAQSISGALDGDGHHGPLDSLNNSLGREFLNEESFFEEAPQGAKSVAGTPGIAEEAEDAFFTRGEPTTAAGIMQDFHSHEGTLHPTRSLHSHSLDESFNSKPIVLPTFTLRAMMNDDALLGKWDSFVEEKLRTILEEQIGGNSFPASASLNSNFTLPQAPDGLTLGNNLGGGGGGGFDDQYDDEDDDEDDDHHHYVAGHVASGGHQGGAEYNLDSDRDLWGDDDFGNGNVEDDFFNSPNSKEAYQATHNTHSPDAGGAAPTAFDFEEFANFDSFTSTVPDFNKTTILPPSVNDDAAFDAFADFPSEPQPDAFSIPVDDGTEPVEDLFSQDATKHSLDSL